jgi:DNA-directed RNA polymerase subunit RPC12/RpoP
MTDFIVLRCPSCGGDIQVDQKMEQCFCLHCGTRLLIKKDSGEALASLAEVQAAMLASDLAKARIKELEQEVTAVRKAFFEFYAARLFYVKLPRLAEALAAYQKSIGLAPDHLREAFSACGYFEAAEYRFDVDRLAGKDIRGFTTADDLLAIYQLLTGPEANDETLQLASVLQPITRLQPELQEKWARLEKAARILDGKDRL